MRQLSIALILLITAYGCMGQINSKILGTWVRYKTTVDNKELEGDKKKLQPADTIFITSDTFKQSVWVADQTPYRQTGVITVKKNKIILTKRTTSTSDQYGTPPDIYYRYKVKNETLAISNAAIMDKEIEENSIRLHYRKLEKK